MSPFGSMCFEAVARQIAAVEHLIAQHLQEESSNPERVWPLLVRYREELARISNRQFLRQE